MRDTVLVRIEGVQACASSDSLEQWPLHYRRGLIDGLFFDESGNARTAMGSQKCCVSGRPSQYAMKVDQTGNARRGLARIVGKIPRGDTACLRCR